MSNANGVAGEVSVKNKGLVKLMNSLVRPFFLTLC